MNKNGDAHEETTRIILAKMSYVRSYVHFWTGVVVLANS